MEKIEHPFAQKSAFSGVLDKNLKSLEKRLGISLSARGDALLIDGPEKNKKFAKYYFEKIKNLFNLFFCRKNFPIRDNFFFFRDSVIPRNSFTRNGYKEISIIFHDKS